MPPRAISTPAKTKKMTASSGKVLIEVSMRWTIVALSTPGSRKVAEDGRDADGEGDRQADDVRTMKASPRMRRIMAILVHPDGFDG